MIRLIITENEENQRLDRFLKKYFKNAPLSRIYQMIRKDVKVNGKRAKEDTQLLLSDELTLYITDEEVELLTERKVRVKAKKQFKVVYEDENLLLVEKPFGLLIHGDKIEKKNTLANQVVDYLIGKGDYVPRVERTFVPSPANRLDRNTTGIVIFGKNNKSLQTLNEMLRRKDMIEKYYLTVVSGELKKELHLKDIMVKDEVRNQVRILSEGEEGKEIETVARPLKYAHGYTLVEVHLITGRSHQIRVHMKEAGYPVIGDDKYGNPSINDRIRRDYGLSTQFLHAYRLVFADALEPLEYLKGKEFLAPLPPMLEIIQQDIFGDENKELGKDRR